MSQHLYFCRKFVILLSLLVLFSVLCQAENFAVKTIQPETIIRRMPDLNAEVVATVLQGVIFECRGQDGDWYEVIVPAYRQRQAFIGFIHLSQVERIGAKGLAMEKTANEIPVPRPLSRQRAVAATPQEPYRFSFGFGLGIPFGVMGVAAEFNHSALSGKSDSLANYYTFNVGLGYPIAGLGYSIGLRIYPLGRMKDLQPKVSVQYGTVAIYNWDYLLDGFSAGAGFQWRLGRKLWLDSDLILILDYWNYSSFSPIKISSGLRWHFQ